MESNERYYSRRAGEEWRAADRALTPAGKARHRELAEAFQLKARQCQDDLGMVDDRIAMSVNA